MRFEARIQENCSQIQHIHCHARIQRIASDNSEPAAFGIRSCPRYKTGFPRGGINITTSRPPLCHVKHSTPLSEISHAGSPATPFATPRITRNAPSRRPSSTSSNSRLIATIPRKYHISARHHTFFSCFQTHFCARITRARDLRTRTRYIVIYLYIGVFQTPSICTLKPKFHHELPFFFQPPHELRFQRSRAGGYLPDTGVCIRHRGHRSHLRVCIEGLHPGGRQGTHRRFGVVGAAWIDRPTFDAPRPALVAQRSLLPAAPVIDPHRSHRQSFAGVDRLVDTL